MAPPTPQTAKDVSGPHVTSGCEPALLAITGYIRFPAVANVRYRPPTPPLKTAFLPLRSSRAPPLVSGATARPYPRSIPDLLPLTRPYGAPWHAVYVPVQS